MGSSIDDVNGTRSLPPRPLPELAPQRLSIGVVQSEAQPDLSSSEADLSLEELRTIVLTHVQSLSHSPELVASYVAAVEFEQDVTVLREIAEDEGIDLVSHRHAGAGGASRATVAPAYDKADHDTSVLRIFRCVDRDCSGLISLEEFTEFWRGRRGDTDDALLEDMHTAWREADTDRSGELDLQEFESVIKIMAESEWSDAYDPHSARSYVYNKKTKETKWGVVKTNMVTGFLTDNNLLPEGASLASLAMKPDLSSMAHASVAERNASIRPRHQRALPDVPSRPPRAVTGHMGSSIDDVNGTRSLPPRPLPELAPQRLSIGVVQSEAQPDLSSSETDQAVRKSPVLPVPSFEAETNTSIRPRHQCALPDVPSRPPRVVTGHMGSSIDDDNGFGQTSPRTRSLPPSPLPDRSVAISRPWPR
jgi:hypothetical protein